MIRRMCLGKIPGLGDFVSRGISSIQAVTFYDCLSHWMQQGANRYGTTWPSVFINAPALGFYTVDRGSPNGPGQSLWLGVVLPSLDKVGRLFPWLVMEHHTRALASCNLSQQLSQCFDAGVAAIRDDWSTQQLDDLFSRTTSGQADLSWISRPLTIWTLDQGQPPQPQGEAACLQDVAWP